MAEKGPGASPSRPVLCGMRAGWPIPIRTVTVAFVVRSLLVARWAAGFHIFWSALGLRAIPLALFRGVQGLRPRGGLSQGPGPLLHCAPCMPVWAPPKAAAWE